MSPRYRTASSIWFVTSVLLALAGCADRVEHERPRLLHREQAAVGHISGIASSDAAAMFEPAVHMAGDTTPMRIAACQVADAGNTRPRLVIDEPVCANIVWGNEDAARID